MTGLCKKCGYQRQSTDNAPEWACPNCGAVYAKVQAHIENSIAPQMQGAPELQQSGLGSRVTEGRQAKIGLNRLSGPRPLAWLKKLVSGAYGPVATLFLWLTIPLIIGLAFIPVVTREARTLSIVLLAIYAAFFGACSFGLWNSVKRGVNHIGTLLFFRSIAALVVIYSALHLYSAFHFLTTDPVKHSWLLGESDTVQFFLDPQSIRLNNGIGLASYTLQWTVEGKLPLKAPEKIKDINALMALIERAENVLWVESGTLFVDCEKRQYREINRTVLGPGSSDKVPRTDGELKWITPDSALEGAMDGMCTPSWRRGIFGDQRGIRVVRVYQ